MSTESNKAVVHRYFAALDGHDLDGLARDVLALDYQLRFDALPPFDAAATVSFFGAFLGALPDARHEVEDQIAEGNLVASRIVVHGTHQGDLQGIPPTGKRLAINAVNVHQIEGGKVAAQWVHSDTLGMLIQLGVIPAPAPDGAAEIAPPARGATGGPAAMRTAVERAVAAFNDPASRDAYFDLYAEELLTHGYPPQAGRDRAGLVALYRGVWAAFPDARIDVLATVAEGDRIATRLVFSGTHRGDFLGVPATGRAVRVGGATFLRFAGEQVIERWQQLDDLGLLQQLGIVPAPEQG